MRVLGGCAGLQLRQRLFERCNLGMKKRDVRVDFGFGEARRDVLRAIPVVGLDRDQRRALDLGTVVWRLQFFKQFGIFP